MNDLLDWMSLKAACSEHRNLEIVGGEGLKLKSLVVEAAQVWVSTSLLSSNVTCHSGSHYFGSTLLPPLKSVASTLHRFTLNGSPSIRPSS